MNEKNLVKNSDLTPSERRKRASKAGKASAEARRKKKTLRELLTVAMEISVNGVTNAEQMAVSMIEAAKAGDVKAFVAIRDTIGEKPVNKVEVGIADNLAEELGIKDGGF